MSRTELWAALLNACKGGHSWELARLCQDADNAALAAAEAKLADERRHADALLNALHNPDNITVERAIEAHHARRAAEVAPKPATARRADAGPFGKWEIEPALSVEHDLQYTNDDNEAFDIATRVLERLWDDMEPGDTRTLRITLNAEVDRG